MKGFWSALSAFFQHRLGSVPAPPMTPPGPLEEVLGPLDELRQKALQTPADEDAVRQKALEAERSQTELQHRAMLEDILQLHQRLGTGFDEARLGELSEQLKGHCLEFRSQNPGTLVQWATAAIGARFHHESLEWAWAEFERRRLQAGIEWPVPGGLAPHADAEEVESHRRLQLSLSQRQFVQGTLSILADLMLGIVPSWRSLYPERGGTVWVGTVYEAVAGALAGARWRQVAHCASLHQADIEALLARALGTELDDIERRLKKGVSSLAEAQELSEQAVARCRQVAPEVVWQFIEPLLPSILEG